jgi:hypothetical protein
VAKFEGDVLEDELWLFVGDEVLSVVVVLLG